MPSAPYEHHYGLKEAPFSIVPDPRFFFLAATHREALAHLLYGLGTDGGGIVLLTGAPGTGKTLLCRALLEAVDEDVDVAAIDDPDPAVEALLASVCRAFGLATPPQASVKQLVDRLNVFLQANHALGRRSVLLIDGAHRLGVDVLEQLRLLTNLETHERKLLQVLLVGRHELHAMIGRHDLRQLAQRVIARCRLRPLEGGEVAAYVHHRLVVAGGGTGVMPPALARALHASSRGVPRTINLLCDRALLGASLRGRGRLEAGDLQRAAQELGLPVAVPSWPQPSHAIAATIMLTVCAAAAMVAGQEGHGPMLAPAATAAEAAPPPIEPVHEAGPPSQADRSAQATLAPALEDFAWPEELAHLHSARQAHAGLLQRWGAAPAGAAACTGRLSQGLRCVRTRGGLAELRTLGLPVVLHLADARGRRIDVLLSKLEGDELQVEVAGAPRRLPVSRLLDAWHGEYTLVWRAPPGAEELLPGSRGAAVAWLRERLALWHGKPAGGEPGSFFDATLQREVREFQVAEGLEPDGIVGMKTLARLAARTDPAMPSLSLVVAAMEPETTPR
jgi:general secretion pathway protein A